METKFLDEFSKEVWETTYKNVKDGTVTDTLKRVAKATASVEKNEKLRKEWEENFNELMSDFKVTAGGRILSNAGTDWAGTTLMNCFVGPKSTYDQDSIEGIMGTLLYQVQTLKSEGGWGMNFSFIRPRGSFIHGIGVESPGPVKFMDLFDRSSDVITAGSGLKAKIKEAKGKIRKGAMMAVMDVWHPSIEEYITAKMTPGRLTKFNISVNCSNEFMDRVDVISKLDVSLSSESYSAEVRKTYEDMRSTYDQWELVFPNTKHPKYKEEWDGNINLWKSKGYEIIVYKTVSVMGLWESITKSTYERNDPGVLFLDIANKTHCWNYGGQRSHIAATNPCIAEGSYVNTPLGYTKVEKIEIGNNISTLHPKGYEPVKTIEVHENIPVFKVRFSDGGEQIVTAAHRYHAQKKKSGSKFIRKLRLDELSVGDFIQVEPIKLMSRDFNRIDYDLGLMFGILAGDGSCGERIKIASSQDDVEFNQNVKNLFLKNKYIFNQDDVASDGSKSMSLCFSKESSDKINAVFNFPKDYTSCNKSIYPLYDSEYNSYSYILGIINGLLATDGNINLKSNHPQIRFDTCSKQLAVDIRRALLMLGVHGRISESSPDGGEINGRKIVRTHPKYTISVSGFDFKLLGELCYKNINPDKQKKIKYALFNSKLSGNSRSAEILSVEPFGKAKVYDLFCEESDSWITDGYVQQGCGEQCLPFGAVCNLGSVNLTQFVDFTNGTFDYLKIKKYAYWLVRFLDNINDLTKAPLPQYEESIKNRRRIGIGVMGWGSALYMLKTRFGSDKAERIKKELMKIITHTAVGASIDLAIEKGMFKDCEPEKHAEAEFWKQIGLPESEIARIRKYGIRNSALFSCQPTGNTGALANIVSGGIEPVYLPEYTRTVIVPTCPDFLLPFVPKYWEGEFKETNLFKFSKEGDESILRAEFEGVVYKIDKSRGLTREVPCIDYGARFLKEKGQWDASADWAATTNNLSVEEHLRDMEGFGVWMDSSMSKTVNIANDYPFDKFKDIYLNAYKTGFLKGITTYRAGTMMSVLSSSEKKEADSIESIPDSVPPKRPKSLKGDLHHFKLNGKEYYVAVGLFGKNDQPYEIFTGDNNDDKSLFIPKASKSGEIRKDARGTYTFVDKDKDEYKLNNGHSDDTADALTRIISTSLRHGSDIQFIVHQLEKTKGPIVSFTKILARTLKKYIKNGVAVKGEECSECGGKLIRQEGCVRCCNCNNSKCG